MSTAAADKVTLRVRANSDIPPIDSVQTTAKNKFGSLEALYIGGEASTESTPSGTAPFKHALYFFVGGTVPDNTDYPDSIAPIGSFFLRLTITTAAVAGAALYLKTAATTWTDISTA